MANLTSFKLFYPSPDEPSITQLLDFFESAPHLLNIQIHLVTSASDAQNDRLVPLPCLKRMKVVGVEPSSFLLKHLLIPAGAKLTTLVTHSALIEDHLPRSLDNLQNLSNFTRISLCLGGPRPHVRFAGPDGQISIALIAIPGHTIRLALESLTQFDTSTAERLDIGYGARTSIDTPYQALLPMKNLRTLTLFRFSYLHTFMGALHPGTSSSKVVICPKLEELVLVPRSDSEVFDIESVTKMAAARATGGAKLRTVRIADTRKKLGPWTASELRKHVSHVECGPDVGGINDDSGDSDGDDSVEDGDHNDSGESDEGD